MSLAKCKYCGAETYETSTLVCGTCWELLQQIHAGLPKKLKDEIRKRLK